jgi:hypothetical protein
MCSVVKLRLSQIIPSSRWLRGVRWFDTDVSERAIGATLKGLAVRSASNHFTPRNNPEDGRTHFNPGGSLRSVCHPYVLRPSDLLKIKSSYLCD